MSDAPKVTLEDMRKRISLKLFFTASDAAVGMMEAVKSGTLVCDDPDETLAGLHFSIDPHLGPLSLLTICIFVLDNGWTVVGKSAPVSPENFDAQMGMQIAQEDAYNQLWPLEGYLLREKLNLEDRNAAAAQECPEQESSPQGERSEPEGDFDS